MTFDKRFSLIANNYPSFQDIGITELNAYSWLKSRKIDDKAEGLWRIHDTIYDLTDFVEHHPGGADWIALTKGTDITEAFEVHHIRAEKTDALLAKYKVRAAKEARNFKFTFANNGFYCTIRRKVAEKLKHIDRKPEFLSKFFIDSLLYLTFITSTVAAKFDSILFVAIASLCLAWTTIAAHNYFHHRDNIRMYYFNLAFLNYREWRISHALSHHLYPNSLHDIEVAFFEPFLCWIPNHNIKGIFQRYGSWIYSPVIYSVLYLEQIVMRTVISLTTKKNLFDISDAIPFALPLSMALLGSSHLLVVLKIWILILLVSSFIFGLIGLNAGHHHPDAIHEGDKLRENIDWGIYTLDTVIDNADFQQHHFLALTNFGHHALHHLFPTLDHGILPQLYPILYETLVEFELELASYPWFRLIQGQFQQLARNRPHSKDPAERLKCKHTNNNQKLK